MPDWCDCSDAETIATSILATLQVWKMLYKQSLVLMDMSPVNANTGLSVVLSLLYITINNQSSMAFLKQNFCHHMKHLAWPVTAWGSQDPVCRIETPSLAVPLPRWCFQLPGAASSCKGASGLQ